MTHHFFDMAVIVLLATLLAVFMSKIRQLPMVGYIVAGVIIGPAVLGLINDESEIRFIAELGVILLLFILGMELPLKSFKKNYKLALSVTFALIGLSLAITFGIGFLISMTLGEKIVYGFIISLSSTAVAVKLLEDVGLLSKGPGHLAISILIAQDLVFVPMVMATNALGASGDISLSFIPKIIAAIAILVGLIMFLSKKKKIHLLFEKSVERHKDLIPVAALAWCLVGAGLSEYAGMSPAFGAFVAGLIIGNSHSKNKILPRIEPMQSVLLMVFFLSIGMLIDFGVVWDNLELVSILLLGTMLFKTIACITLLKLSLPSERWRRSFVAGLSISQIGEFSFIIAAVALGNGIFDDESYKVIIAVIALSLSLSPLWMLVLRRFTEIVYTKKSAVTMENALIKVFCQQVMPDKPNDTDQNL